VTEVSNPKTTNCWRGGRSGSDTWTGSVAVTGDIYLWSSTSSVFEFVPLWIWSEKGFHIDIQYVIAETGRRNEVSDCGIPSSEGRDITCLDKRVCPRFL
jgi:hypothetical protein